MKTNGSTGSTRTDASVVIMVEYMVSNVEFIIQSLALATKEGSKHLSVGAGGRGGVLLIPVDTDIPVAIHPTIATPLMQLKIAP